MTDGAGGRGQLWFAFAVTPAADMTADDKDNPSEPAIADTPVSKPPQASPREERPIPVQRMRSGHPRTRGTMPVPKPLTEAIEAGHFGTGDDGKPIRPSRDEVREITASHAETLKDAVLDRQQDTFERGITQYAESFGPGAAEQLRSYVQQLAREAVRPAWRR